MEGLSKKQLMRMRQPNFAQPYLATSSVNMASRVLPCRGLLGWGISKFYIKVHNCFLYAKVLEHINAQFKLRTVAGRKQIDLEAQSLQVK